MKRFRASLIPILLLALFGYLVFSLYADVKRRTIEDFNAQQMILAKEAATGIRNFFLQYQKELTSLANLDGLVQMNEEGRRFMEDYYKTKAGEILAITRVDDRGRIIHTVPYNHKAIGVDISYQAHIRQILDKHQPVVSDVFKTVQGYDSVALHVPVMRGDRYLGSLAVLIPFQQLAESYLQSIHTGKSGYAWVLSEKGVELYCPVPGHLGKTISETFAEFPSVLAMAKQMLQARQGTTVYEYNKIRNRKMEVFRKLAAYAPIDLGNTFWSIVIATPESEVLETLETFRNKLYLLVALITAALLIYFYFTLRAWAIVREENVRKRAARARQESEKKYQDLVENASSIILRWNTDGAITFINPYGFDFFGYTEEELLGRNVVDTIVPSTESGTQRDLVRLMREICNGPQEYRSIEHENIRKNGSRVWVSWTHRAILDEQGKMVELLSIGNDLTEKKQLESQLLHAQKMEAVGTLAGGVAHDFNNLLQAVQGYAELLILKAREGGPGTRELSAILKAAKHGAELTKQLLTFSRKLESKLGPMDLNSEISSTVKLLERTIPKMIEIRLQLSEPLGLVNADSSQMEQVLVNLAVNAKDAIEHEGHIQFKTDNVVLDETFCRLNPGVEPGAYVLLSVSDNGKGMEPEIIQHIFDPFFTTKGLAEGTGLGLAMVYGIVKNHGGHIFCSSESEIGTTFRIYLPALK